MKETERNLPGKVERKTTAQQLLLRPDQRKSPESNKKRVDSPSLIQAWTALFRSLEEVAGCTPWSLSVYCDGA